MISFSESKRPDRCELCRFGCIESRYLPPPAHSIAPFGYTHATTSVSVIVCKRMPPVANADGKGVSPVVHMNDYCGEFKGKEGA